MKNTFSGLSIIGFLMIAPSATAGTFSLEIHQASGKVISLGEINSFKAHQVSAKSLYEQSLSPSHYNGIVTMDQGINLFLADTLNGLALYVVNQKFPSSFGSFNEQNTLFSNASTNGLFINLNENKHKNRKFVLNYEDMQGLSQPLLQSSPINFHSSDETQNLSLPLEQKFNPQTDSLIIKAEVRPAEIPENSSLWALFTFGLVTLAIKWLSFSSKK